MKNRISFVLVLAAGIAVQAQTVNIRGKISNQSGQAVTGAIVELSVRKTKDTTGSDGAYAFSGPNTAISPSISGAEKMILDRGALEFELAEPSPVAIDVIDLQGNRLKSENLGMQGAGHYRWAIEGNYSAHQMLIVRVFIGNRMSSFRYMPMSGGRAGLGVSTMAMAQGQGLARIAAVIDTVVVAAAGYTTRRVLVESYDAKLDIVLDRNEDRWGGLKNPPARSAGCGKTPSISTALRTITSGGKSREYWIDLPPNYDKNTPSKVIFVYHWVGGTAASMKKNNYYNIQPQATAANVPTIFIAPTHGASEADHGVFLDILSFVGKHLCVDTTRVFSTGYSHGGMMTYSLTTKHQNRLRAAAGIAAANFNVWLPNPKLKDPIAYMGITGMYDEICIWDGGNGRGAKYIALEKATNNGCKVGADVPHWTSGAHFTYEYTGCKTGYPVVIATFNGKHGGAEANKDPGASSSWVPKEIWSFFSRF